MGLFCEKAKAEMLAAPLHSRKSKQAFLAAVFHCTGALQIARGQTTFLLRLDYTALKQTVCGLLGTLYKDSAFAAEDRARIWITGDYFSRLALDLKIFTRENGQEELAYFAGIHPSLVSDSESRAAYLRGLFLAAGAVTIAKGYHLEFDFTNGFLAVDCERLLDAAGFRVSSLQHKEKLVLYIKDSETVSDLLAYLGASKAVMELNDVFVKRATDKLTNRRINCDMANIDKTIATAQEQIQFIRALEQSGKLNSLPEKLRAAAAVRLAYPEASLATLAEHMKISKSGLRHRLDKLAAVRQEEDITK